MAIVSTFVLIPLGLMIATVVKDILKMALFVKVIMLIFYFLKNDIMVKAIICLFNTCRLLSFIPKSTQFIVSLFTNS